MHNYLSKNDQLILQLNTSVRNRHIAAIVLNDELSLYPLPILVFLCTIIDECVQKPRINIICIKDVV
jgi:hypothetical protein